MSADRRKILVMMCFALATVVSAVSSLNVALPDLARDTGATPTELQWIVDAYALVFAGLLLPAGAVGDRAGRPRVLLAGLAIFGTGAAIATRPRTDDPDRDPGVHGPGRGADHADHPVDHHRDLPGGRARSRRRRLGRCRGRQRPARPARLGGRARIATWSWVFGLSVVLALIAFVGSLRVVPAHDAHEGKALDPVGGALSASPCRLSCGPSSRVRSVAGATRWWSAVSRGGAARPRVRGLGAAPA